MNFFLKERTKIFLFFILLILVNNLLYPFLIPYTEKTSFIWNEIENRKFSNKEFDLLILGDSQVMSGIHPSLLEQETNLKILFYPRPSEQVEGIYFNLKKFYDNGFKFKKVIVNFSEISNSKNPILESHKTLALNFQNFSKFFFTEKILFNLYLKNFTNSTYYLITEIFPLLKLNSNFTREINLVPKSEGFLQTKEIEPILNFNLFGNLIYNFKNNKKIKNLLEKENFFLDWANLETNCIPNQKKFELPIGSELAFVNLRKESIPIWIEIYNLAKKNSSDLFYLKIPFSNTYEKKIKENFLIRQADFYLIQNIKEKLGEDKLVFIETNFSDSEFGDYTHLNYCGMIQLTKELSSKLNQIK